ncbi:hypothetical protein [Phytohabitans houttuyneae]|uniref:hypothetical protein n=1 Tax=Phytohabitans houttuyneae TaxID=1076126 RepID=UPI0015642307|nr:hypothetical protein [Phytohabitans houttuyneae]
MAGALEALRYGSLRSSISICSLPSRPSARWQAIRVRSAAGSPSDDRRVGFGVDRGADPTVRGVEDTQPGRWIVWISVIDDVGKVKTSRIQHDANLSSSFAAD